MSGAEHSIMLNRATVAPDLFLSDTSDSRFDDYIELLMKSNDQNRIIDLVSKNPFVSFTKTALRQVVLSADDEFLLTFASYSDDEEQVLSKEVHRRNIFMKLTKIAATIDDRKRVKRLENLLLGWSYSSSVLRLFATEVTLADVAAIQAKLCELGNESCLALFAMDVRGANLNVIENTVLEMSPDSWVKFLALCPIADVGRFEEAAMDNGSPDVVGYFAFHIRGADKKRLGQWLAEAMMSSDIAVSVPAKRHFDTLIASFPKIFDANEIAQITSGVRL